MAIYCLYLVRIFTKEAMREDLTKYEKPLSPLFDGLEAAAKRIHPKKLKQRIVNDILYFPIISAYFYNDLQNYRI
jgi:hypothetical protein